MKTQQQSNPINGNTTKIESNQQKHNNNRIQSMGTQQKSNPINRNTTTIESNQWKHNNRIHSMKTQQQSNPINENTTTIESNQWKHNNNRIQSMKTFLNTAIVFHYHERMSMLYTYLFFNYVIKTDPSIVKT